MPLGGLFAFGLCFRSRTEMGLKVRYRHRGESALAKPPVKRDVFRAVIPPVPIWHLFFKPLTSGFMGGLAPVRANGISKTGLKRAGCSEKYA